MNQVSLREGVVFVPSENIHVSAGEGYFTCSCSNDPPSTCLFVVCSKRRSYCIRDPCPRRCCVIYFHFTPLITPCSHSTNFQSFPLPRKVLGCRFKMVLLSLLAEAPALPYVLVIGLCTVCVYLTFIRIANPQTKNTATNELPKLVIEKVVETSIEEIPEMIVKDVTESKLQDIITPQLGESSHLLVEQIPTSAAEELVESTSKKASTSQVKDPSGPLDPSQRPDAPVSVNYFPSRLCNYKCGFCFHTETTSFMLDGENTKRGLKLLKEAGMRKLNIAGGEPFLHPKELTMMLQYCKEELGVESISIVSNGSKITEEWMAANAQWLDILAISCDSFDSPTNQKIGRGKDGKNVERLRNIAAWCRTYNVKFKINTVVNKYNWNEDMVAQIAELAPFRWKVFQCLIVAGENDNPKRKRDATKFLVTDEQWRTFCDRHKHLPCYVPEDNNSMASSYLLLDEYMRFLDKGEGMIKQSESLLDIGVMEAMKQVVWDTKSFVERGGIYDWTKEDTKNKQNVSVCGTILDMENLEF